VTFSVKKFTPKVKKDKFEISLSLSTLKEPQEEVKKVVEETNKFFI